MDYILFTTIDKYHFKTRLTNDLLENISRLERLNLFDYIFSNILLEGYKVIIITYSLLFSCEYLLFSYKDPGRFSKM